LAHKPLREVIRLSIIVLAGILLAVLLGAISPGPSFLVVARISISQSRRNGVAAAAGMGVGGAIFAILALLGLKALLAAIPWLYVIMKIFGGIYLVYIGICMWRGAKEPIGVEPEDAAEHDTWQSVFSTALFTQLSNPKTAVFYSSIFAALLPQTVPLTVEIILPILVFLLEAGWYCIVALLLSATAPRLAYIRSKVWIDRVIGSVMGLLGIKLILSSDTIV
jgi:RhtB (resistance to homoserine/threonine) family protein